MVNLNTRTTKNNDTYEDNESHTEAPERNDLSTENLAEYMLKQYVTIISSWKIYFTG